MLDAIKLFPPDHMFATSSVSVNRASRHTLFYVVLAILPCCLPVPESPWCIVSCDVSIFSYWWDGFLKVVSFRAVLALTLPYRALTSLQPPPVHRQISNTQWKRAVEGVP